MMRGALAALLLLCPGMLSADGYATLSGHGGPVMAVAVNPRTGEIATASFDNSVGLWPGKTGARPAWLEGHRAAVNAVLFLPGGGILSGGDDFRVLEWSGPGAEGRVIAVHKGKVAGLAVTRNGGLYASASWDGTITLADAGGETRVLRGHESGVNAVRFSPDGRHLYSGSADGTLRVWDTVSGRELRRLVENGFGINELSMPPGGEWLAYGTVDGAVRVIDPEDGRAIADFTLDRRPILALAHDPALGQLAIGDGDGYIMVVGTADWQILRDFHATLHGPVWALAFSPDGTHIYAGGLDDALHRWPVATLSEQAPIEDDARSFLRDPAEMENGERQFARKCSICHSLTPGNDRRAGPTLHGLFGRPAGSVPDYRYSEGLAASGIVWSGRTVNELFEEGPESYVPGTKMPMQRITSARDRDDLVSYLRRATRP